MTNNLVEEGLKASLLMPMEVKGKTKVRGGKDAIFVRNSMRGQGISILSQQIGKASVSARFITRPLTSPKVFKIE